jgi:hypothetical protein
MKPVHAIGSVAFVFCVAIASTVTGMRVSQRADYLDGLQKQISKDEARIQVLRTELAYLSSPQRVQALVDLHRPDLATPSSKQYVLNVHDVLPGQSATTNIIPAVVQNSSRAQADRLIAVALPKAAPMQAPAPKASAQPLDATSIEQVIAVAEAPLRKTPAPVAAAAPVRSGLSGDLLATVQNIAAKDVRGQ